MKMNVFDLVTLASLPDATGIKSWVVSLAGNLIVLYLIFQVGRGIITQRWGMVAGAVLGGALLIWIVNFTDSFVAFLGNIVQAFGG